MKIFTRLTIGAIMLAGASTVNAQNRQDLLFLAGDALSYGWSLDDATALVATAENDKVYTGTVYLEADKDFKFLTTYDFGNKELHPVAANATPDAEGKVSLMVDGDDNKIHVTESANYLINVDTESLTATIVKSAYQQTHIPYCVLFMVGSAFESNYNCDQGHIMRQNQEEPYLFASKNEAMLSGLFKIDWAIKGAGTWDKKYWYFRDADDATKMILAADGDNQWEITTPGNYDITANILTNTIDITSADAGVTEVETDDASAEAVYYNLQGERVANPEKGSLVIRVAGGRAHKLIF